MKKKHFYLYGVIANEPGAFAAEWGIVAAKQVADFVAESADAEELIIHINSQGGDVDEGFAIHDILATSGKKITTIIEGLCASIATVPALAGSTREMTEHSTFFIHNAWGAAMGDADELQKYADACKAATDKIIDFYVKKTGADRDAIEAMMDEDTSMTATQAKDLGFITEVKIANAAKKIQPVTLKKVENKKSTDTNNQIIEEMTKVIDKKNSSLLASVKTLLGIKNEDKLVIENKVEVTTDKGVLYCEKPKVEGVISVDDVVTIDGAKPEAGDYTADDETVYTIDAEGKVTAVKAPTEDVDSEEVAALKVELAAAKKESTDVKAEFEQYKTEITEELEVIKNSIKSGYKAPKKPVDFQHNKTSQNNGNDVDYKEAMSERKKAYKNNGNKTTVANQD